MAKAVQKNEGASMSAKTFALIKNLLCSKTFFGNLEQQSNHIQLDCFIQSGNCQPITGKIVCINPTFLTMKTENWEVYPFAFPYENYFPVTFEEQLDSNLSFGTDISDYSFCKNKLQFLVSELRSRKDRITFHHHFGDCIQLCLENNKFQNKFHVIHCSQLIASVGLANIITATYYCLNEENPDSFLLTETREWKRLENSSLAQYVKMSLCCSISMIPTMYGVRLANHLQLGIPFCTELHDVVLSNTVNLKWCKTPGYSSNVKLNISATMKEAIDRLAQSRFVQVEEEREESEFPNRLLTYYSIMFNSVDFITITLVSNSVIFMVIALYKVEKRDKSELLQFAQIRRMNEELKSILMNLPEGIILINDESHEIVLQN